MPAGSEPVVLTSTEVGAGASLGAAAPGCEFATYDSPEDAPDDALLQRVEFYIPPYMGVPADFALMSRMPNLAVVQLPTAGYEHVLTHVPAQATLCNAGGVHDASTAEAAIALMLASLRRVDEFARAMPQGAWLHGRYDALADRRVLVIGAGGVGRAIAARLAPFEVDVRLVGRTARSDVHGADELTSLLPWAEVVVLAVPLTAQTAHLVDSAFLARLRDGALVVNVGRGGLIDQDALVAAAASGRIRAALDVTDPEPLPAAHPLWRTPGVLISPHIGGNTSAFLPRMQRLAAEQIRRWRAGEALQNVVRGPLTTLKA